MRAIATLIDTALPRAALSVPVSAWLQVRRERRALAGLTSDELADLGIDREAARAEAARPFWDLPNR
ncbi:MAG: DUF1127 domain-containing protein [Pikeienuella sp.]